MEKDSTLYYRPDIGGVRWCSSHILWVFSPDGGFLDHTASVALLSKILTNLGSELQVSDHAS